MDTHFVAFLDILGFSEMVASDCNNRNQDFRNLGRLSDVMQSITSEMSESDGFSFTQFSDSIVISAPFDRQNFGLFIGACKSMQQKLFRAEILCRGGVAVGRHYSKLNFIFSEALIEAYRIESMTARVPRIVVSKNLLDLIAYPSTKIDSQGLLIDRDRVHFIDYLKDVGDSELRNFAVRAGVMLDRNINASLREKFIWMLDYIKYIRPALDLPDASFVAA